MNRKENKRFHIELEVVTPLSIGAGNENEWIKGCDYVQKDGKVYVIDVRRAYEMGVDIERLSQLFYNSDDIGICQLLGSRLEKVSRYFFDSPATSTTPIKTFLRSQFHDRPLVAGSSIKGAIRSALFNEFYMSMDNPPTEKEEKKIFGGIKDNFMKFIQVGDIEMPRTVLVNTKIFNLQVERGKWIGGWKHRGGRSGRTTDDKFKPTGFNTLYECVPVGEKGNGTITFADYASCRESDENKKKTLWDSGLNELFRIINDVTDNYLYKEYQFFKTYPSERSEEIKECISRLRALIPNDNSYCLMKMSAGTGFHAITGDWQYDDYVEEPGFWLKGPHFGKKKYKSRKIAVTADGLKLMGFVILRKL